MTSGAPYSFEVIKDLDIDHVDVLAGWGHINAETARRYAEHWSEKHALDRAMAGMAGVFAQLEADLIRERTMAGLAAARKRGKVLGRPRALTASQVEKAGVMVRKGVRLRAVAKALGVGYSTVRRALAARLLEAISDFSGR